MARFTAASISGSERSTRLRKWNRLVLARFTAVEATISTEPAVANDRALAVAGQFLEDAGQFLEDAGQFLPCNCRCSNRWQQLLPMGGYCYTSRAHTCAALNWYTRGTEQPSVTPAPLAP